MKKMFYFFAIILLFFNSCKEKKEEKKGYGETDCDGYNKGVTQMNLPQISSKDYNSVRTLFYRLGHWKSCEYGGRFKLPLSEYDTLMVAGYVTDTICKYYFNPLYKVTDGSTPSDQVPFVFLYVGDTDFSKLPDSTEQAIHDKINGNKGKKIYVRDIFRMWATWDKYPYSIIPGKGFGDAGPDFVVPYILIRSKESIRFEN